MNLSSEKPVTELYKESLIEYKEKLKNDIYSKELDL